jgi:hypothetical protein
LPDDRRTVGMAVIRELVRMLPADGAAFPASDQAAWLQATASTFVLIWGANGVVKIEVETKPK